MKQITVLCSLQEDNEFKTNENERRPELDLTSLFISVSQQSCDISLMVIKFAK